MLALLIGVQVRWLRQLEAARRAELSGLLERGVVRIAEELDEQYRGAPWRELGAENPSPEVDPDVVEAAARDVLGPAALDTYRVEIVAADGARPPLFRSRPEEDGGSGPAAASAPVFPSPGKWVGFAGTDEAGAAADLREIELPPMPGPPAWLLEVCHREGSLADVVARGRVQNLAIGGGLLAVLVAGVALLLVGERRARRLAEKELLFVAGVSHELRTPLTVIRTAASNLEQGVTGDPERVREYGAMIGREAERVGARIERALRFADRSLGPVAREDVDPAELVTEAVEACRHWRDRRTYRVETNVADDLPRVHGDRAALVSALANLVDNAIKYGPDGQTVRVRAGLGAEGRIAFDVVDEGAGIPKGERARIFRPFHRGQSARANRAGGSGLGLAVVAQVAADHGGEVVVAEVERGTAFSLRLPANGRTKGGA